MYYRKLCAHHCGILWGIWTECMGNYDTAYGKSWDWVWENMTLRMGNYGTVYGKLWDLVWDFMRFVWESMGP